MLRLIDDVTAAFRALRRAPGVSLAVVLTIALGLAANAAVFSFADAILFRPLPVRDADSLLRFGMTNARSEGLGGISSPDLRDLARQSKTLSGLAGFASGTEVNFAPDGASVERVTATSVSGNYFGVLGVAPAKGRLIGESDDAAPGANAVIVLSDGFWRRRFAASPDVIGRTVRVNTTAFAVVGVTPPGFHGTSLEVPPDVFVPLSMAEQTSPFLARFKPFERRGFQWIDLVGRVAPGFDARAAVLEMNELLTRNNAANGVDTKGDRYDRFRALPVNEAALDPDGRAGALQSSSILLASTGLLLMNACAVAAGLLLVRGERRRREIAVRFALGAARARIARLLFAESAILAVAGLGLGLAIASAVAGAIPSLPPIALPFPMGAPTPVLELRVVVFSAALATVATLLFGALPALRASSDRLGPNLARLQAPASGARVSSRDVLVAAQVALSAVLLVGAGLLLRSLSRGAAVDPGFTPENALVASIDVSKSGYDRERGLRFYERLSADVRALPGVLSVATARHVPVQGAGMITSVELTNFTPPKDDETRVMFTPVSAGFFRTIGLRLDSGRDFRDDDRAGPSRLIVNRAFADRFWPGLDPLRERVLNFGAGGAEVIGVAANAKLTSLRESPQPMIYVPDWAFATPDMQIVVRTAHDPRAVMPQLMDAARRIDATVPVLRLRTLEEHVAATLGRERAMAAVLSAFAFLAVALAAAGLYGVVAYSAQQRSREFGVRLALGARPESLVGLVLAHGTRVAFAGVVLGLAASALASRALASLLFDVSPLDAPTFAVCAAALFVSAAVASAAPALRAARADPAATLRAE